MSSADVWKYRGSVLGHEDCLAANSKSMGRPQKSADDRNCVSHANQKCYSDRKKIVTYSTTISSNPSSAFFHSLCFGFFIFYERKQLLL